MLKLKKPAMTPSRGGYIVQNWWIFLITIILGLGGAWVYKKLVSPEYFVYGSIIINDNEQEKSGSLGGLSSLMSSFSLGAPGSKSVEDEIYKIKSYTNLREVVERLNLNHTYWSRPGLLKPSIEYFDNSPIVVNAPKQVLDTIGKGTRFDIEVKAGGKQIHVKAKQGKKTVADIEATSFPVTVKTPLAIFSVNKTKDYNPAEDLNFKAFVCSPHEEAVDLSEDLGVKQLNKKSNVILLDICGKNIDRSKAVINTIVENYNQRSLEDRREQAENQVEFIESRLMTLYTELEQSESQIERYKRDNKIVDAEAEAEYIFKHKSTVDGQIIELQTQQQVIDMVLDFLRHEENKYSLVPFAADLPDDPISAYNELVLKRMNLMAQSKGQTAQGKAISEQVDAMRTNLMTSLERNRDAARIALADMNRAAAKSDSRIEGIPTMEKELMALYRDQKIKNQIYAYLLQKREESELKRVRTTSTGKIIDEAHAAIKPYKPKSSIVYGIGLVIGIGLGFAIILLDGRLPEANGRIPESESTAKRRNTDDLG